MTYAYKKAIKIVASMLDESIEKTSSCTDVDLVDFLHNKYEKYRSKKYIISIDMGCGNTSAAICLKDDVSDINTINWDYSVPNIILNKPIRVQANLSIPTIIYYNTDNKPCLGPDGLLKKGRLVAENFKNVPSNENLEEEILPNHKLKDVWSDYFMCVLEKVIEYAKTYQQYKDLTKENYILIVAHPASDEWNNRDVLSNYKEMIAYGMGCPKGASDLEKKEFWDRIITFSEAKAAMQYVNSKDSGQGQIISTSWAKNEGIVVIDLGASTIDIEVFVKGKKKKEYSLVLGGRDIDRLFALADWFGDKDDFKKIITKFPTTTKKLFDKSYNLAKENGIAPGEFSESGYLFNYRIIKESVCDNDHATDKNKLIEHYYDKLNNALEQYKFLCPCDHDIDKMDNIINCSEGKLEKDSSGCFIVGCWYDIFDSFVKSVIKEYDNIDSARLTHFILTGGTANIIDLEKHIKELLTKFKSTSTAAFTILNQNADYDRTVPYGSLEYVNKLLGKRDGTFTCNADKILCMPRDLMLVLKISILNELTTQVNEVVCTNIINEMQKIIDEWADLPEGSIFASEFWLKTKLKNNDYNPISSEKLRNIIKALLVRDDTQKKIKNYINEVLKKISATGKYKECQLELNTVFSTDHLQEIIKDTIKNYYLDKDVSGDFSGLFTFLGVSASNTMNHVKSVGKLLANAFLDTDFEITEDEDIIRSKLTRKNIARTFKKQCDVTNTIEPEVKVTLEKCFSDTYVFGMVESCLAEIENLIFDTMFIGLSKEDV